MMLCHHLWGFPARFPDYVIPHGLEVFGFSFCRLCVSIFLFISGYGLMKSAMNNEFGYKKSWDKIKNTYLMFWKVFVIFIPIGFLMKVWDFDMIDFLGNVTAISWTYNQEWWFLSLYMEILLIFPLLFKIKNKHIWLILAILSIIVTKIVCNVFGNKAPDGLLLRHIYHICYYWGTVLIGCICAKYEIFEWINKKMAFLGGGKFVAYLLFACVLMGLRKVFDQPMITLLVVPCLALGVSAIPKNNLWVKPMEFIGANSMNMWLIHSFICYYYFKDILMSLGNPILIFIMLTIVSLLLALATSYLWKSLSSLLGFKRTK